MDEYFELGYVKKTSGLKGMLLVQPDTDRPAHYLGTDAFFLEDRKMGFNPASHRPSHPFGA